MKSDILLNLISVRKILKRMTLIVMDTVLLFLAFVLSVVFRYYTIDFNINDIFYLTSEYRNEIILCIIILVIMQYSNKQYCSIWKIAGLEEFILGVQSLILGTIINCLLLFYLQTKELILPIILTGVLGIVFCNGMRLSWRWIRRSLTYYFSLKDGDVKRVLIFGAGAAGALVLNEYKKNPQYNKKIVVFADDNRSKLGKSIASIPVLGNRNDLPRLIRKYQINEVIIAIAELPQKDLREILDIIKNMDVRVNLMRGLNEMIDDKFNVNMIREIEVEDLLAREPVKLDTKDISEYLENKVVMVTGGGGSIGSELCRQIAKFKPEKLIIVDIYENNAYDLQGELAREYTDLNLETLIASVRDRKRMEDIYKAYKPSIIFHAAAHKHVPLMEVSPSEAIKNNVIGTLNCAELASAYNAERFVLISTDKAVNPTNVMGATKRLCEMIIQAINNQSNTDFVAVRFGNVLGSNGSVVPLFKKQIAKGGPVTLTHKDITRYFMTIPEAAQLVLQAGGYAKGGEIFILDMGQPVKIYDLAKNLITLSGYEPDKDIKIKVTGLRPGEKLYEELLMKEEGLQETRHKKIFIGQPQTYNLDDVKNNINILLETAKQGNKNEIKERLKEFVPTYREVENEQVAN